METENNLAAASNQETMDTSQYVRNTGIQSLKNKEFEEDTNAFYSAWAKYCQKYNQKIAGFSIVKWNDGAWILNVNTFGEID